jgi:hypothetical protein
MMNANYAQPSCRPVLKKVTPLQPSRYAPWPDGKAFAARQRSRSWPGAILTEVVIAAAKLAQEGFEGQNSASPAGASWRAMRQCSRPPTRWPQQLPTA